MIPIEHGELHRRNLGKLGRGAGARLARRGKTVFAVGQFGAFWFSRLAFLG